MLQVTGNEECCLASAAAFVEAFGGKIVFDSR
jgi:hypothetical protein